MKFSFVNNVGAKGQWIVEMFDYLLVKPQIKMICYFNIDKETDGLSLVEVVAIAPTPSARPSTRSTLSLATPVSNA